MSILNLQLKRNNKAKLVIAALMIAVLGLFLTAASYISYFLFAPDNLKYTSIFNDKLNGKPLESSKYKSLVSQEPTVHGHYSAYKEVEYQLDDKSMKDILQGQPFVICNNPTQGADCSKANWSLLRANNYIARVYYDRDSKYKSSLVLTLDKNNKLLNIALSTEE